MAADPGKPLAGASDYCVLCSNLAGTVDLLPPGHPDGLSQEAATVSLKGFIGTSREIVSTDKREALQAALAKTDAAALYGSRTAMGAVLLPGMLLRLLPPALGDRP